MKKETKNTNRNNLTSVLKSYRHFANLTQSQLAKKMGTKQPSIARAEKGNIKYNLEFAEKWIEACGGKLWFRWIDVLRGNVIDFNFFPPNQPL